MLSLLLSVAMAGQCANGSCSVRSRPQAYQAPVVTYVYPTPQVVIYSAPAATQSRPKRGLFKGLFKGCR